MSKKKKKVKYKELCLPKTYLFVSENELVRQDKNGNELGRFQLSEIQEITVQTNFDIAGFVFVTVGLAFCFVGYTFLLESVFLQWITMFLGITMAGMGVFSLTKIEIVFQINDEEIIYEVKENADIVKGFVISLKSKLKNLEAASE